jgi:uncharacterized protein YmfQ (DUF2313 family)
MSNIQKAYKNALIALRPQGIIWEVQAGGNEDKKLNVLSSNFAKSHEIIEKILKENDPRTTIDLLKLWEKTYGLKADGLTYQERIFNLVAKYNAKGGQSISYFKKLAQDMGYEAEIIEHRPFVCGLSKLGQSDELASEDVVFHWHIKIKKQKIIHFRCGASEMGDAFAKFPDNREIENIIQQYKPAHSSVHIGY